jgi:hypothetical protein
MAAVENGESRLRTKGKPDAINRIQQQTIASGHGSSTEEPL